jgi:hypothetical protein
MSPGLPRWAHRPLPPAYGARLKARGRRGPPVDYLDKPSATPTPGGQFLVSPRGHFPMSLDTAHAPRAARVAHGLQHHSSPQALLVSSATRGACEDGFCSSWAMAPAVRASALCIPGQGRSPPHRASDRCASAAPPRGRPLPTPPTAPRSRCRSPPRRSPTASADGARIARQASAEAPGGHCRSVPAHYIRLDLRRSHPAVLVQPSREERLVFDGQRGERDALLLRECRGREAGQGPPDADWLMQAMTGVHGMRERLIQNASAAPIHTVMPKTQMSQGLGLDASVHSWISRTNGNFSPAA